MKTFLKIILGLIAFIILTLIVILTILYIKSPGEPQAFRDASGNIIPRSISNFEKIQLGGLDQWIYIRGKDTANPVCVYLHGGPGSPEFPFVLDFCPKLDEIFTVVHWEQRGAGKSYSSDIHNNKITLKLMVKDAIELSDMMGKRFNKPKVYLLGHSWGSLLGIHTISEKPELFYAYLGIGQVSNQSEGEQISYDFALKTAKEKNFFKAIRDLEKIGRPPYKDSLNAFAMMMTERRWVTEFGGAMYGRNDFFKVVVKSLINCEEYTLGDKFNYIQGSIFSLQCLWNTVIQSDLPKQVPKVDVPVFIFQGLHDYQTPYKLAKDYFDTLQAPQKEFFTFDKSAHSPIFEEPDKFCNLIKEKILINN